MAVYQNMQEEIAALKKQISNLENQAAERKVSEEALRLSQEKYTALAMELDQSVQRHAAEVQDLYDNAPCGYHSVDANGRFVMINQTELTWLGYTREEVVGRMSLPDILTAQGRQQFAEIYPLFKAHGTARDVEYDFVRKDGSLMPVILSATAIYGNRREYVMDRSTVFDHTGRKQVEKDLLASEARLRRSRDELSAANAALEKAARMKDEFLASMSHELRTPLTGILGISESLQFGSYGSVNDLQKNALKLIESSGWHLLSLINDILDITRIEAGMLELQLVPCSLLDICQSCLQLTKGLAHHKKQQVGFTFEPTSIVLNTDVRRLKQMLVNLLSNAVKFTPAEGKLGLAVTGSVEKQQVSLSVWDTGIGIRPEDMQHLFEPFVQLDAGLNREQPGTGLGLSLVQRITRLHGGSLHIESMPEQGSRFTIILPWSGQTVLEIPRLHDVNLVLQSALTIEESPLDADHLTGYLSRLNIRNTVHSQGVGAVDAAARLGPGVILLDLLLPDRSGLEVLEELRTNPQTRDIPVIITSVAEQRSQAKSRGADGYLLKPFSLQELQQELEKVTPRSVNNAAQVSQQKQKSQPHVLVVDDNEMLLEMVSDFFRLKQFQVDAVRSGDELLSFVSETRPDVILLDIQMPGMDGLEAAQRIRTDSDPRVAGIPIVAITALAMPGDRERCLSAGVNDYFSKPLNLPELAIRVSTLIENKGRP